MKLEFARPDASQLAFRFFDRVLHPELFDTYAESHLTSDRFDAVLRICRAGHAIEFRHEGARVTEVVGTADQELPRRGCCLMHRLRGGRDLEFESDGLAFCCSAHVEQVDPEIFEELHLELQHDAPHALLAYEFPAAHRLQKPALSVMQAEVSSTSFLLHTFHTFPDCHSIIRTQSLFEY